MAPLRRTKRSSILRKMGSGFVERRTSWFCWCCFASAGSGIWWCHLRWAGPRERHLVAVDVWARERPRPRLCASKRLTAFSARLSSSLQLWPFDLDLEAELFLERTLPRRGC